MNLNERLFIAALLFGITIIMLFDLSTDSQEGVQWIHLCAEGGVAIAAISGIFLVLRNSFSLKHSLESEKKNSIQLGIEAEKWRAQSKKHLQGLSQAIEDQLNHWQLTNSEKEISFLLLKGLSLKEIAEIRKTSEKTTRSQSTAIYAKAGLNSRSELAAFFLEDLLLPQVTIPAKSPTPAQTPR